MFVICSNTNSALAPTTFCGPGRSGIRLTWVKTNPQLVDPLVLEWAALNDDVKFKARDIPRKIQFFINVLASADNHAENDDSLGLSVEHLPQRLKVNTPFAPRHRYRFTVTVIGDQIEPKIIQLVVNWNGNWKFDSASLTSPIRPAGPRFSPSK
jgi:hypothetical protein